MLENNKGGGGSDGGDSDGGDRGKSGGGGDVITYRPSNAWYIPGELKPVI